MRPELRLVPDSTPQAPAAPPCLASPWWRDLLCILALGASLALVVGWLGSERRAVLSLEPEERALVFQESWDGFQRLCSASSPPGLSARCREQARFLLLFPECQGACQEQARLQGRALR
ncbi:hypothetical protein [Myxococcus faecalis]|uniref:hypothetical protein n=1 Tax=Myxococcus faecalis TaxID=3115646 RepID=UPI003CE695FE